MSSKNILSINGPWYFSSFEPNQIDIKEIFKNSFSSQGWLVGDVPGTIQGSLCKLSKTPDPFFKKGANAYRFLENKEHHYYREFILPKEFKENSKEIFLCFEGIDTISTIYLNGKRVGSTQNMFTPYEFKVTDLLVPGKNKLLVKLESILKRAKEKDKRGIIKLTRRDWFSASYIRKANFAYGGDMSQRMITVGIWRPVYFISYEKVRILNTQVITELSDENNKARVFLSVELEKFFSQDLRLILHVKISEKNNKVISQEFPFLLKEKKKIWKTSFDILSPNLWWPNGLGDQSLYSLEVKLLSESNELLDDYQEDFGIRKVELLQERDKIEGGRTFTFSINGIKVFAKGANWFPADLIYPVPKETYKELIISAKEANFNMLRINGAGIYEDEEFYRLCDEMGIMIWQDFMFSDCMYPDDDEEFLRECKREAEIVVEKLRNHPCIVLWCGENEVHEIYYSHGYKQPEIWGIWGEQIFQKILPEVCKRLDSTRPYWPGSPWSSPGKFPFSTQEGDFHLYPVTGIPPRPMYGYGKGVSLPLSLENTSYRLYAREKQRAKFYSEFGLASVQSLKSLEKIMDRNDFWPIEDNPVWKYNIAASFPQPVKKFLEVTKLLNSEFGDPRSIDDFILYSQLSQATTLKFATEHFRARKFSCSGALFCQYNECWPTITLSVIDYYLNRKIAYYWVKRAFSPLLITFIEVGKEYLNVWLVNDLLHDVKGKLLLSKMDFWGKTSWIKEKDVTILPNSSTRLERINFLDLGVNKNSEFLWARLEVMGKTKAENRYFFFPWADLIFPKCKLRTEIKRIGEAEHKLIISSDIYARLVKIKTNEIKCRLSDNYFDLTPGEKREVIIEPSDLKKEKELLASLSINALNT